MKTVFENATPSLITGFAIGVALLLVFDVILFFFMKRTFVILYTLICEVLGVVGYVFEWGYFNYVILGIFIIGEVVFLFANLNEYRIFIANSFKGKSNIEIFKRKKPGPESIFDREAVYEKVYTAVVDMSRIKRGALITFMKKDNLLDESKVGSIIKQRGVDVDAPVSPELLETIFYEGTRLHDGAVIIKDDKIARAAVFFTSTARPLTGKYGSRHQAAIGISENSDSVTVIVSEETGRISIAFQGELTPVTPDNFLRVFEDDMAYEAAVEPNNDSSENVNDSEDK